MMLMVEKSLSDLSQCGGGGEHGRRQSGGEHGQRRGGGEARLREKQNSKKKKKDAVK
jgi:hypothetical protein